MRTEKKTGTKQTGAANDVRQMGRYIVADPKNFQWQPTFRGTRIMVDNVLEMVAEGLPWEAIVYEWREKVPREAIAEAVQLAREVFVKHAAAHSTPNAQRKAS